MNDTITANILTVTGVERAVVALNRRDQLNPPSLELNTVRKQDAEQWALARLLC